MKWEYCVIPQATGFYGWDDKAPKLWYLGVDGCRVVDLPKPEHPSKGLSKNADKLMQTIARLGEERWELTGCGSEAHGDCHALYFKRPKQEI